MFLLAAMLLFSGLSYSSGPIEKISIKKEVKPLKVLRVSICTAVIAVPGGGGLTTCSQWTCYNINYEIVAGVPIYTYITSPGACSGSTNQYPWGLQDSRGSEDDFVKGIICWDINNQLSDNQTTNCFP